MALSSIPKARIYNDSLSSYTNSARLPNHRPTSPRSHSPIQHLVQTCSGRYIATLPLPANSQTPTQPLSTNPPLTPSIEKVHQPETVTLSTATLPSGKVSARMVYLKEVDSKGFVIYSNFLTSRKSHDLKSNPYAALTFWWHELERQVRVSGPVERLTAAESQVYYDTRIRGSRIGAWASQQSTILNGREELEKRVKEVEERFEGQEEIPVPEFWGGLRILPEEVEFWQGRESRLHDRFRYSKEDGKDGKEGAWKIERLSP
jgi:pyridoxamine 5'-phosphate oxidase